MRLNNNMRISSFIKSTGAAIAISTTALLHSPIYAQTKIDTFERTVLPSGSTDSLVLKNAPCPDIDINGKNIKAAIVVDIKSNTLYKYDKNGNPETAYLVASGKKSTPSVQKVCVVSHTEHFPYRGAPRHAKRRRNPSAYGTNIIVLDNINTQTGEKSNNGQWIHGNNNASCIGQYVSNGCIRMDNEVIKQLSAQVKRGDIVIFK